MDDKDWIILKTLAEKPNLSHASKILYISQSSLTYRIRQLEKEFNTILFIKKKTSLEITNEGILLGEYAKEMLTKLSSIKDQLQEMNTSKKSMVKLAVGLNFSHCELPLILNKFHSLYPNIDFNISPVNLDDVLGSLANAENHITIIRGDFDWNSTKLVLRKDPFYLISKNPVLFRELPLTQRIIYKLSSYSQKLLDTWWQEHFSSPPQIGMTVDNFETCIKMVKESLGYAIIPLTAERISSLQSDIYIYPATHIDSQPLALNLTAYYRKDFKRNGAVKTFIKFLQQYYE